MNTYINGFRFAVNDEDSEFILSFTQKFPVIADDGSVTEVRNEEAGSFVMTTQVAQSLCDMLDTALKDYSKRTGVDFATQNA